jgi:hypothetical protein
MQPLSGLPKAGSDLPTPVLFAMTDEENKDTNAAQVLSLLALLVQEYNKVQEYKKGRIRTPTRRRYSVYLHWYKSANTDAGALRQTLLAAYVC